MIAVPMKNMNMTMVNMSSGPTDNSEYFDQEYDSPNIQNNNPIVQRFGEQTETLEE